MKLPTWVSWALAGVFALSVVGQVAVLALPGGPEHGNRRLSGYALEAHVMLLAVMVASSGLLWSHLRQHARADLEATVVGFCFAASLVGLVALAVFLVGS